MMTWILKKILNQEEIENLKPFLSIVIIVSSLFFIVFAKMEERRIGYQMLKYSHEQKKVLEEKRMKTLTLAKLVRPQQVEKMAQDRLTLKKIQKNQIIHLNGGSIYQEFN